ncbi:hypothetical protein ACFYYB_40920 [Streptomyces sp. NPDC002886]|uniref:hypothetical protein n=1 Tax=Streptomyces sp. NPDC002886 TaxID=3364667 RepID=UPI00368A874D
MTSQRAKDPRRKEEARCAVHVEPGVDELRQSGDGSRTGKVEAPDLVRKPPGFTQALLCLARRRADVLFAMLRDGTFYEPQPSAAVT